MMTLVGSIFKDSVRIISKNCEMHLQISLFFFLNQSY